MKALTTLIGRGFEGGTIHQTYDVIFYGEELAEPVTATCQVTVLDSDDSAGIDARIIAAVEQEASRRFGPGAVTMSETARGKRTRIETISDSGSNRVFQRRR